VAKTGRISAAELWNGLEMHDVAVKLADSEHTYMAAGILIRAYRKGDWRGWRCGEENVVGAVEEIHTPVRLPIGDKIRERLFRGCSREKPRLLLYNNIIIMKCVQTTESLHSL
jgi:hypothetical protein